MRRSSPSREPLLLAMFAPGALALWYGDVAIAAAISAVAGARLLLTCAIQARAERALAAMGLAGLAHMPLARTMDLIRQAVLLTVIAVTAALVAVGAYRGLPADFRRTVVVSLVVGAAPLELPAVTRALLARAAGRMGRRGVILLRLSAVETLAASTVVCTHRTGLLTQNRAIVTSVVADGQAYETSGADSPEGGISSAGRPVSLGDNAALDECLRAGVACNDAIVPEDGPWLIIGDPREGALLTSAAKLGLGKAPRRVATLPFTAHRRFMATLHRQDDHEPGTVYVKGAVERVLYLCRNQLDRDGTTRRVDRTSVLAVARSLERRGLDVLAFAAARVAPQLSTLADAALPELTFLGLQAVHDPIRRDAVDAVRACREAGVEVKLLTGMEAGVAGPGAAWVGLTRAPIVTGAQLAACSPARLPAAVNEATVFAGLRPEETYGLVRTLQSLGHVVTLAGGSDEITAARFQADTGVSTRDGDESADVLLRGGGLASVAAAIGEARGALRLITRTVAATFFACVSAAAIVIAFGGQCGLG
ncbi:hypothetical protein [Nonomuraea lactucae]|uniref:hypothetical protein n=1 Tax=Nonomuraea lactucae TaxID=2249762 RepID=UPI000DE25A53|nr:hypothetical protein [Nonomuraea lactucae]